MANNYNGMYIGIVVQNNDPDNRGRVKVFVPHVNAAVYNNWNNVKDNKTFSALGQNIESDLDVIIDELKANLPWAEQASPLGGQSSTGKYNAYSKIGSVSDANTTKHSATPTDHEPQDTDLNLDGIGESPAKKYEYDLFKLNDAFSSDESNTDSGAKRPNKYSYDYTPDSYSNCAKGVFGVPNVGAHVYTFFLGGDPQVPVYFAAAFGQEDWSGVFNKTTNNDSIDYPGAYENYNSGDAETEDINIQTYRNKFLINQKGGTLEFVNTDNREILKMTHYSGSFKEFNNNTSVELAANNDQKLVLKDQYLTVNGFRNVHTERDLDYIVRGDSFLRVGKQDTSLHTAWKETARELHHIKQLFETQRADKSAENPVVPGAFVSPLQTKSGSNSTKCPVCNKTTRSDKYWELNETFTSVAAESGGGGNKEREFSVPIRKSFHTGVNAGDTIQFTYVAPTEWSGGSHTKVFGEAGACPACGDGLIQGSMDGSYTLEPKKQASSWLQEAERIISNLADIEADLGMGGSQHVNVAKHKTETIGMVMNDFGSVRIDTQGKYYKNELKILSGGIVNSRKTSPLIEYVHVDDLPGGSYTLNVCNKWNVQVGAGGVSMKSYGPVDIGGTVVNMGGTQVNIASENEVNIDGGERLSIVSDILVLRQRTGGQVLVDSNLGVTQNVIIGGGLHVEGELTVQHVTAPCEIQETEQMELWGRTEWRDEGDEYKQIIGYLDDGKWDPNSQCYVGPTPVYSRLGTKDSKKYCSLYESSPNCIRMHPHSHHFKNLPLNLKNTNAGVRDVAKSCEDTDRAKADGRDFTPAESKSS